MRTLRICVLMMAIAAGISGCATSPSFINYGLCDDPRTAEKGDGLLRPISWSKSDTDETIREVKAHNATVEATC